MAVIANIRPSAPCRAAARTPAAELWAAHQLLLLQPTSRGIGAGQCLPWEAELDGRLARSPCGQSPSFWRSSCFSERGVRPKMSSVLQHGGEARQPST